MDRVAILGLGLMGGSLAMALRRRGGVRVQVFARRAETRDAAWSMGLADAVEETPRAAVHEADLTVVCVPVMRIPELIRDCCDAFRPGAVVTDVGSTKAWVQDQATRSLAGTQTRFVGSHPIAGSEQQGLQAATPDLYDGAITVITGDDDESAASSVERFWMSLGSRVVRMSASDHDQALARTSHLPHFAASLLAIVSGRGRSPERWGLFCGSGFRDATRIAEGGPDLWLDILRTNREPILHEITAFSERIQALVEAIRSEADGEVSRLLEEGCTARRRLLKGNDTGESAPS